MPPLGLPTLPFRRGPTGPVGKRPRVRDKALLIGLTYAFPVREPVGKLDMPHRDLDRLASHLTSHWGYLPHNITKMKDGDTNVDMHPTRDNIVSVLRVTRLS